MAITALHGLSPAWYTPEQDGEEDQKTSFKLKPLNGSEYMEVIAETREDGQGNYNLTGQGLRLAIKYGLVGWKNFADENEKPVKFNKARVGLVPPVVLTAIATEVINRSELGDDEKKNLIIGVNVKLHPDQFNCETCAHRFCDVDGAIPGSNGPAPFDKFEITGVGSSRTCFLPLVSQETWQLISLYSHYKNHHLLDAGGISNQSNYYLEAMDFLNAN